MGGRRDEAARTVKGSRPKVKEGGREGGRDR